MTAIRNAIKMTVAGTAIAVASLGLAGVAGAATEFTAAGPNKVVPAEHHVPANKGECKGVSAAKVPSRIALLKECDGGGLDTPQA